MAQRNKRAGHTSRLASAGACRYRRQDPRVSSVGASDPTVPLPRLGSSSPSKSVPAPLTGHSQATHAPSFRGLKAWGSRPVGERMRTALRLLDQQIKRLVIKALALLLRSPGSGTTPEWSARPHRILYLRYDRIGDMVLATGIIKAIAMRHPTVAIDVLASAANASVLQGNPYVSRIYTIDKKRVWSSFAAVARLRRRAYDAVVDTAVMGASLTTTLLMWTIGAHHRIGVAGRGNDFALTLPVQRLPGAVHYVDHSASLLRAFGIDPQGTPAPAAIARPSDGQLGSRDATRDNVDHLFRPEVYLSSEELSEGEALWRAAEGVAAAPPGRPRRLLVNVSAGEYWRYWPEARFIAVLKYLGTKRPGLSVLVVGAPEDEARKICIARGAGVAVAQTARLRQMIAVVAASDFVLTADTSVTHIASAFSKPLVGLFARGRDRLYGPYGTAGRSVSTPDVTLESLDIQPVIRALDAVLAAEHRRGARLRECTLESDHALRPAPAMGTPSR